MIKLIEFCYKHGLSLYINDNPEDKNVITIKFYDRSTRQKAVGTYRLDTLKSITATDKFIDRLIKTVSEKFGIKEG